ncbi:hypothetical protein J6P59_07840 [bacterium]|nr:hypothetical protein [bacterium]
MDFRKLIHKLKKFNSFSNLKILNIVQNDFLRLFDPNNLLAISFKLLGMVQILAKIVNDSVLKGKINQLIGWLEDQRKLGLITKILQMKNIFLVKKHEKIFVWCEDIKNSIFTLNKIKIKNLSLMFDCI